MGIYFETCKVTKNSLLLMGTWLHNCSNFECVDLELILYVSLLNVQFRSRPLHTFLLVSTPRIFGSSLFGAIWMQNKSPHMQLHFKETWLNNIFKYLSNIELCYLMFKRWLHYSKIWIFPLITTKRIFKYHMLF